MDWKCLLVALLFFIIAGWFYMQHEHVNFNYSGSYWEKLDQGFDRPWFKNNSRPDIQRMLPMLPFLWDGYHCFSWLMKLCYWLMFAIYFYKDERYLWYVVLLGLGMAFGNYFMSLFTYGWTFV